MSDKEIIKLAEVYANNLVILHLEIILDKTIFATKTTSIRKHLEYKIKELKQR